MKQQIISSLKKILPENLVKKIQAYRKNKRDQKRFSYNQGESFFKTIHTESITFDICLNPSLNKGVDDVIAETGVWEPALSQHLKQFLSPEKVFLDIGANIGYHSLFAAKVLAETGHVYSFEPQTLLCEQLKQSIQKNTLSNITIFQTGLSDHEGNEILSKPEENIGGSTLLKLPEMERFHGATSEQVPITTLDSYIKTFSRVDVIKIDIEGLEYEALKGGEKIIDAYHPIIIMEFSPVFYVKDYAEKPADLILFLKKKGYGFFSLENDIEIDPIAWTEKSNHSNSQIDIICKCI